MLLVAPAHAAEKLRVGKAVAFAWTFTPLDIGIQTGIFAKHGLEIEASDATGADSRYDFQSRGRGERMTSSPTLRIRTSSVAN